MFIPDQWYAIVESQEVSTGRPLGVRRLGRDLVLWRDDQGRLAAFEDRCPHRSSQLSLGRVLGGRLQCPFHGFEFDGTGACQLIPANGRASRVPKVFQCVGYPVTEAHGFAWLWQGKPRDDYPPVPWFDDLDGFTFATTTKTWDVDLTRAVEGLLDVSHLPFVHAKTIGRDRKTLVNGPYTTLEDNTIRIWLANQPDEGLPALKPTQLPPPDGPASLEFRFPNFWILRVAKNFKIVNVIAPIEEGSCKIYIRSYFRKGIPAPLARLLGHVLNYFNQRILAEDYPVIHSQSPKVSGLDIGEHLIPADRPIAVYLQHRRDLIQAADELAPASAVTTSQEEIE